MSGLNAHIQGRMLNDRDEQLMGTQSANWGSFFLWVRSAKS